MVQKILRILTIVVLSTLMVTSAVEAWNAREGNLQRIYKDEDGFWNYDFEEEQNTSSSNVDWTVNLIFWYDASVDKIKQILWGPAEQHGTMYIEINDSSGWVWDNDKGTRSGGLLETGYHTRLYAAGGARMNNETWGRYVVATSHIDIPIAVPPRAGYSEFAEQYIAGLAGQMGYIVKPDAINFYNEEPERTQYFPLPWHVWLNNGLATTIKILDYASHTSLGQALRGADGKVVVPVSFDSVNDRVTDTRVEKDIQSYRAQASYPYSAPSGQPPKGSGMEMLYVGGGDDPFTYPGYTPNNPAGKTTFWQTVSSSGTPKTIATAGGDDIRPEPAAALLFIRGDADNSGSVNVKDAVAIAQYLAGSRAVGTGNTRINPVNAASVR